ncbi:MAG: T9SS type A sorting domain-containing protein [Crocinitomicaceae bacterium]
MRYFKIALYTFLLLSIQGVYAQSFEQYIQSSSDDAEEKFDGSEVITSSSDIEMMYDTWNNQGLQTVGLRFSNVTIPSNSLITNAYIQFTADGSTSGNCTLTFKGEDVANAQTYIDATNNISNRPTTTANVQWSPAVSWSSDQSGLNQRTPDLSSIVSEVITSNGWQNGNAISFIVTGNGSDTQLRKAHSYDEDPVKSAKLVIEYTSQSDIDLTITSINTPSPYNYPNANAPVQVELFSYGNLQANTYSVELSLDGNLIATEPGTIPLNLGQSTVFDFQQTLDLSIVGNYNISAEVIIAGDEDLANNAISSTIEVINEIDPVFFNSGSSWRYFDQNVDPGLSWMTPTFNDSSWFVGLGHMGLGEGDEQTVLNPNSASYYFRKKINIPDVNQLNAMYMHLVHDDAAIVFINGQEVLRTELMPLGNLGHFTTARQSNNSSIENEFYTYKLDPNDFVNGINTIAICLKNRYSTDGDLSFDCYLTPTFNYSQDGPYVSYNGTDIIVEEVTTSGHVSNTYTSAAGIQLTCTLPHMGTSFSFPLKDQINIEPSEYNSTPSKFLTISDFDGHIEAFTMLLRGEGIIDNNFNWTYGDGHLIISGDLFDRGFHVTECMWLLYKLESEAELAGGKVHLIIGNHEMFNLTDDWRYVEVKYFNNAHLMGKRMSELYDSNTELGRWLRSKNIVERIGNYAFMHGGISPEVDALDLTYDEMNNFGRLEMDGNCSTNDCDEVNGSDGLYWYRGMAEEDLTQIQVDNFVTGFGVERVIIGHTKDNTARSLYEGRVLAIDMYHMDNFNAGFMEALQFELGCFYIFHTDDNNQTYTLLDECDNYLNVLELDSEDHIEIYPNPATDKLNIKLSEGLTEEYEYSIIDQKGSIISKGKFNSELKTINIESLTAGKYYLNLESNSKTITGYFILR